MLGARKLEVNVRHEPVFATQLTVDALACHDADRSDEQACVTVSCAQTAQLSLFQPSSHQLKISCPARLSLVRFSRGAFRSPPGSCDTGVPWVPCLMSSRSQCLSISRPSCWRSGRKAGLMRLVMRVDWTTDWVRRNWPRGVELTDCTPPTTDCLHIPPKLSQCMQAVLICKSIMCRKLHPSNSNQGAVCRRTSQFREAYTSIDLPSPQPTVDLHNFGPAASRRLTLRVHALAPWSFPQLTGNNKPSTSPSLNTAMLPVEDIIPIAVRETDAPGAYHSSAKVPQ